MKVPGTIILSRPDGVGDSMVTLPMAGWIKAHSPSTRIIAVIKEYTRSVWASCIHIDAVLTLEELRARDAAAQLRALNADAIIHVFPHREVAGWAKAAGIPLRVGTSHRWWHWTTCNARVAFSRKRSDLHEAQLNLKLLEPLGLPTTASMDRLAGCLGFTPPIPDATVERFLVPGKKHVLVHPFSMGSGVEWGLDRFTELIRTLDPTRYRAIITGTAMEAERYRSELPMELEHVADAGGALTLAQLIALIGASDAMVAASTGPLHIAAACGKRAIGLYAPVRPIHPGRWAPIGPDAHALTADAVQGTADAQKLIHAISPDRVIRLLDALP